VEPLEPRQLLASGVNISQNGMASGKNSQEGTIAIDPTSGGTKFFAAWNNGLAAIEGKYSSDAGSTWTSVTMPSGSLAPFSDPMAAYDLYGNLFFSYLTSNATNNYVVVLESTNSGQTWLLNGLSVGWVVSGPNADKPVIAVGPGASGVNSQVVVSWDDLSGAGQMSIRATASSINSAGDTPAFGGVAAAPVNSPYDTNLIQSAAIGPNGTIMVCWQTVQQGTSRVTGPSTLYIATAPALIPIGFNNPNVPAVQLSIGTQSPLSNATWGSPLYNITRGVSSAAELAWDRVPGGQYNGRVYLVFMDQDGGVGPWHIWSAYSTGSFTSWSNALQVDDDRTTGKAKFLPQVAIDQGSGYLAAAWYDCRKSPDGNQRVQVFGAVNRSGGVNPWTTNQQITSTPTSFSSAIDAASNNNFGDYNTMTVYGGRFWPIWASNAFYEMSPPPASSKFDMVTIKKFFTDFAYPQPPLPPDIPVVVETSALIGDSTNPSQFGVTEVIGMPLAPASVVPILQPAPIAIKPLPPLDVAPVDRLFSSRQDSDSGNEWQIELALSEVVGTVQF
jgi:hypothetical protein